MGFFKNIFSRTDAKSNIIVAYNVILAASRNVEFYGETKYPDSYDGRLDCLTAHMAVVMAAAQADNSDGKQVSQALFDAMVDDFDVSLREEGLTDAGVKRRMKKMIGYFYKRLRDFTEALERSENLNQALMEGALDADASGFSESFAVYLKSSFERLSTLSLDDIRAGKFGFEAQNI